MILVRPHYDKQTDITFRWAADLLTTGSVKADLAGSLANRPELDNALKRHGDAEIIAFYGHGSHTSLHGQPHGVSGPSKNHQDHGSAVIEVRDGKIVPESAGKKKIYAVACDAGMKLGPAIRRRGGSFVGYSEGFKPIANVEEAKHIVNSALIAWRGGKQTRLVARQLRRGWTTLARKCKSSGVKQHLPDDLRNSIGAWALHHRENVVHY